MQGRHKKFDQNLYNETNDAAIARVLQLLHDAGLHGALNEDLYGPDIVVYKGYRKVSYIEVEVKRVWQGSTFPWDSIQLPERKGKYLRLRDPIEFWILNSSMDHAVIIPESAVTKDRLVEVPNSQVSAGELFYQIPLTECIIRRLDDEVSSK